MSWLWVILMMGFWPIAVFALVSLALVLFLTGTIGVDGLFAATENHGNLTCWHCGEETPAGRKRCTHCNSELQ